MSLAVKVFVACLFFEESQQPTWPQVMHKRKCTQSVANLQTVFTTLGAGGYVLTLSRCVHSIANLRSHESYQEDGRPQTQTVTNERSGQCGAAATTLVNGLWRFLSAKPGEKRPTCLPSDKLLRGLRVICYGFLAFRHLPQLSRNREPTSTSRHSPERESPEQQEVPELWVYQLPIR